ncbi:hypothetical protein [Caldimonas tepidiphila]|uniref:hypothetical protein n=1 Tax=Caldimonas tepidiphila TaxID=2315841 RepID=UPI000E5C32F2|nr:hypothetical protein [Caldimonas tepidiphila]
MGKFLLGFLVGMVSTASYMSAQSRMASGRASPATEGRVDELSSALNSPAMTTVGLNAGDGTPNRGGGTVREASITSLPDTRH